MRVLRAVAAVVVASGIVLAVPATAHADETRARQWYLTTLRLAEAHKEATGDGVTVGLVDSGLDPAHPDLTDAVAGGEVFGGSAGSPGEQGGNGTADAAILAGRGHGEDAGVLGIAPDAEIVSAEIAAPGPQQSGAIAEAIGFLTEQKVDIIAVAIPTADDEKLSVVTQQAAKQGIPVVANSGGTGEPGYPVGSQGTINVVGSDKNGEPTAGDATVPGEDEAVTVAAPAQDLPMAGLGDEYGTGSSTSFATAIVAGTMALVKEKQPGLEGEELIAVVADSASGDGKFDEQLGYGIVDPVRALGSQATTSGDTVTGTGFGGDNTTLALIIAVVGVLGLAALVVIVRVRDRSKRLALAAPGQAVRSDTGTMPRISDTGTMPRISDTGTMPRVTDPPPGNAVHPHTPPYGHNRPHR